MPRLSDAIPALSDAVTPPTVLGTAELTHCAYGGETADAVLARIDRFGGGEVSRAYDRAIAFQLSFRRAAGLDLLDEVLAQHQLFRVASQRTRSVRLLALVAPGDLMANAPLDFVTRHLGVRLDLLYVVPGRPLPAIIPDHDLAFFAAGEADPDTLERLAALYAAWPRPALNNPALLPRLERDALPRVLAGIPGLCSPAAVAVSRADLEDHLRTFDPIAGFTPARGPYPCLIRPNASHAGTGLARATTHGELSKYLRLSFANRFFITAYEDYAGADGLYRKLRVAFIDRVPFLCHMAVSSHWMVHYLNAGMTESAAKRAEEAEAMATFDAGFAGRHRAAFASLHQRLPFDYYSVDCAETRDGRLLVFEADTAAIIHAMDPPDLFPYKPPAMQRAFQAFEQMLLRHMRAAAI